MSGDLTWVDEWDVTDEQRHSAHDICPHRGYQVKVETLTKDQAKYMPKGAPPMIDQPKNPKISSPSLLALVDQINGTDKDEREHVWLAMEAIYAEMKNYGLHGVVALALINSGMMYAVKRGD